MNASFMNGVSPLEPIRNDRVRVLDLEQHQRAAEPLDVRPLPRLAGDEILGDDACLERLACVEIGVRELDLRLVHRRLEPAVDADLDQLEQRRARGPDGASANSWRCSAASA